MPHPISSMTLAARSAQFQDVLARCEITVGSGELLETEAGVAASLAILDRARTTGASVYVIGNGGSAGIASHAVIDLVHVAKLRAFTLHDCSLLTCMANDYGYENAFARTLAQIARPGDVLIAISSSGKSPNIRNAAAQIAGSGGTVITLSGFAPDNPLRSQGAVNFWLDSCDFGLVEVGHQFILHNLSDRYGAGCGGKIQP